MRIKAKIGRIVLQGLVNSEIHPDWVDTETMSHVFRGIAVTVRYVPTQRSDRPEPGEDFAAWEGHFYGTYSHEPFVKLIKPGTVVVIDDEFIGNCSVQDLDKLVNERRSGNNS